MVERLGGVLGTATGAGVLVIYAFGIFANGLLAEYGWGRSVYSYAQTSFMIASGLGSVWLGFLIARYGIRLPAIVAVAGFTAAIVVVALLPASPVLLYALFAIIGVSGAAATQCRMRSPFPDGSIANVAWRSGSSTSARVWRRFDATTRRLARAVVRLASELRDNRSALRFVGPVRTCVPRARTCASTVATGVSVSARRRGSVCIPAREELLVDCGADARSLHRYYRTLG